MARFDDPVSFGALAATLHGRMHPQFLPNAFLLFRAADREQN